MKSKLKFTPWFIKGEKPVRIGVYQASCKRKNQTGTWYSYWNGKHFCTFSGCKHQAERTGILGYKSDILSKRKGSWRGLATPTGK